MKDILNLSSVKTDEAIFVAGTLTFKVYKQEHTLRQTQTHLQDSIYLSVYVSIYDVYIHTHAENIHQRLRPPSEETLRLKKEHCVSLPSASPFISVQYSLLIFALCTADNVCKSLLGYLAVS